MKIADDDDDDGFDNEQETEDDQTTTTTTTTGRSVFNFPTRNRNMIPSRRPIQVNPISAKELYFYFIVV